MNAYFDLSLINQLLKLFRYIYLDGLEKQNYHLETIFAGFQKTKIKNVNNFENCERSCYFVFSKIVYVKKQALFVK